MLRLIVNNLAPWITTVINITSSEMKAIVLILMVIILIPIIATYIKFKIEKSNPELAGIKYKFTEMTLPTDKELYILGTATPTKEEYPKATQKGIIKETKVHGELLISRKKGKEILKSKRHLPKYLLGILGIISIAMFLGLVGVPMLVLFRKGVNEISSNLMLTILVAFVLCFIPAYLIFKKYIYKGLKFVELKEKIKSIPTSEIGSMSMGLVEVKGKPEPVEKPLKSPLTSKECVGYIYKIEKSEGKKGNWIVKERGRGTPVFYLNDGTGKIPVDPSTLKMERENLDLSTSHKKVSNPDDLPPKAKKILEEYIDQSFFQWIKNSI